MVAIKNQVTALVSLCNYSKFYDLELTTVPERGNKSFLIALCLFSFDVENYVFKTIYLSHVCLKFSFIVIV